MSTLIQIDSNVTLHGVVDAASLSSLTATFKRCLYLCPDEGGDSGIDGGFAALATAFPTAEHISINPNEDIFQPDFYQTNASLAIHAAVTKYASMERSLDSLLPAGPTLIMCKSNRRAGLVWATYTGKIRNQIMQNSFLLFVVFFFTFSFFWPFWEYSSPPLITVFPCLLSPNSSFHIRIQV